MIFLQQTTFQANRKDLQRFLGLNDCEEMVYIRNVRRQRSSHHSHSRSEGNQLVGGNCGVNKITSVQLGLHTVIIIRLIKIAQEIRKVTGKGRTFSLEETSNELRPPAKSIRQLFLVFGSFFRNKQ